VGIPLALAGLVGTILAIRALQPRPRARRGDVAPIETPPREALDAMEWPHAACPRCGFMDLLWGGPARLVARCVRCGYQGEPGVFDGPRAFEAHLDELRRP
jgi:Zn ribbon nucleic-acid-binding protein